MNADVAVIGGGIVGLAVARRAARAGARVMVIDRGAAAGQATWAAAGMLAPQAEADRADAFFSLLMRARAAYPAFVEELRSETGVDVAYRGDGMILVALSESSGRELEKRYCWQRAAGLEVERLTTGEARSLEPTLSGDLHGALRFGGDHQVDNRLLSAALIRAAGLLGVSFVTERPVRAIHPYGGGVEIELDDSARMSAGVAVIAAGSWSGAIGGLPRRIPVEPVFGELIALAVPPELFRHTIASELGYMVPRADGRLIIGATSERVGFRTGGTRKGLERLTAAAHAMAPELSVHQATAHWSGLRPGTPDGAPIIGRDPDVPTVLYATGHYRNGILLGPLTGELVGSMAVDEWDHSEDLTPFRADRFDAPGA